jgi:hypothetical protein
MTLTVMHILDLSIVSFLDNNTTSLKPGSASVTCPEKDISFIQWTHPTESKLQPDFETLCFTQKQGDGQGPKCASV